MPDPLVSQSRAPLPNPVTGDLLQVVASPLLGDGDRLDFRCTLPARSPGSPPHRHRALAETFEVERGVLMLRIGRTSRALGPGDRVAVPAGVVHAFHNATDEPVTFFSTVAPGAGFERFLRAMYGLAADGRTTQGGLPRDPRVFALLLEQADLVLAQVPDALQRPVAGALGWLGRASGVERSLQRYWPTAGAAS